MSDTTSDLLAAVRLAVKNEREYRGVLERNSTDALLDALERRLAAPQVPESVVAVLKAAWALYAGHGSTGDLYDATTRWDNVGRPGLPVEPKP